MIKTYDQKHLHSLNIHFASFQNMSYIYICVYIYMSDSIPALSQAIAVCRCRRVARVWIARFGDEASALGDVAKATASRQGSFHLKNVLIGYETGT